ncbi:hypothetical protein [Ligilactobacillus acidipiscis]|uniref:hypothetical protein n=1 Tax=Ligilactobacillus acidipiscis TaxID=89059 RepID=UPI0009A7AACC|nr:hypothetical protein [Ligilactobacillus acidipiscis]
MGNLYIKFFRGVNDNLFSSFREVFVSVANKSVRKKANLKEYLSFYDVNRKNDYEKIKKDYQKIGDDLFGELNNYERRKGYKLTTRK